MMALTLDLRAADLALSESEFHRLCQANQDVKLELTAGGHLIMSKFIGRSKLLRLLFW